MGHGESLGEFSGVLARGARVWVFLWRALGISFRLCPVTGHLSPALGWVLGSISGYKVRGTRCKLWVFLLGRAGDLPIDKSISPLYALRFMLYAFRLNAYFGGIVMDKKLAIKEFLLKNIIKGKKDITYDDSLINSGLVDSFGILELVFFMESTFGVRIEDYEILDAEADTINRIVALLGQKE